MGRKTQSNVDKLMHQFWSCSSDRPSQIRRILEDAKQLKVHQIPKFFAAAKKCPNYSLIEGCLFPETISQLYKYGFSNSAIFPSEFHGLTWEAQVLLSHGEVISEFVSLRKKFGNALVLGEYITAGRFLDEIEEVTGNSLYWIEKQFLLTQLEHGLAENKRLMEDFLKGKGNPLLKYICTCFSQKVEGLVNFDNLRRTLSFGLRDLDDSHPVGSYLYAMLGVEQLTDAAYYLNISGDIALIDRYLATLKVIRHGLLNASSEDEVEQFQVILNDLSDHIEDPELENLKSEISTCPINEEYLTALDEFSLGKFNEAAELGAQLIRKLPTAYVFYELTAKSMAYSSDNFVPISKAPSLANQIAQYLYTIFRYKRNVHHTLCDLEAIALNLGENNLSLSIMNRVHWERDGLVASQSWQTSCLMRKTMMLNDCLHYNDNDLVEMESFSSHPYSILMRYKQLSLDEEDMPEEIKKSIVYKILYLRRKLDEGSTVEVINDSLDILKNDLSVQGSLKLKGKVLDCRFEALFGEERYAEAMRLVSDSYAENLNLLRHTTYQALLSPAVLKKIPDVSTNIDLPILEYLLSDNTQEVYRAVSRYFRAIGCKKPTDFIGSHGSLPQAQLRLFLKDVLSMKVISRGYRYADSTQGLENQRSAILKYLYSETTEQVRKELDTEMTGLAKKQLARETLKKVNPSCIYVDTQAVKDAAVQLSALDFERYLDLRELDGKNEKSSSSVSKKSKLSHDKSDIKYNESAKSESRELLFSLFQTVLIEFLVDSEKSLNQCLSDKIRHGPIGNHIRRPFEQNHLLYKKNEHEGIYESNGYWHQYGATNKVLSEIDSILSAFTGEINKIAWSLRDDIIQFDFKDYEMSVLKVSNLSDKNKLFMKISKKTGLFDYSCLFEDTDVVHDRLSGIEEIEEFFDESISIIWQQTEDLLDNIKDYLQTIIVQQAGSQLDKLASRIDRIVMPDTIKRELMSSVQSSRTAFEAEITHIQSWFNMPEEREYYDLSLSHLIESARSLINSCSGDYLSELVVDVEGDINISGAYTGVIYDIIYILLQNIAVHAEISKGKLRGHFSVSSDKSSLEICVENNVRKQKQLLSDIEKARKILRKLSDGNINPRHSAREGMYGIIKIWNTISKIANHEHFEITIANADTKKFIIKLKVESNELFKINSLR